MTSLKSDPITLGEKLILPANDTNRPNDNVLIVGSSGTGKSMSVLMPSLFESKNTNPILNYAKEFDAECMARYLSHIGYKIEVLNLVSIAKSTVVPDPLLSIESYEDIEYLSAAIVNGTIKRTVDDYWQAKARPLLSSLIAAVFMTSDDHTSPGMADVLELFDKLIPRENGYSVETELDTMFMELEKASPGCYAAREYRGWHSLPYRTASCVRDTLAAALSTTFPESIRRILRSKKRFDIEAFAKNKRALIIITSGIDDSQQYFANLVNQDTIRGLLRYAACCPAGHLPRSVRFYFDDFAGNVPLYGLPKQLCVFRSAGVSAVILLQAESSLEAIYGSEADVIRANCACYCYFPGGMDDRSIEIASKKFDTPYQDILSADMGKLFVVRTGHKPVYIPRFNTLKSKGYRDYLTVNGLTCGDEEREEA